MKPICSVPSTLLGFFFAILFLEPFDAYALEKYGRPLPSMKHAGEMNRDAEETLFSGYFLTAAFPYNPSYFARPNNTGLVGMRYMLHLETDLYKQYLTFYTDQNFFSDRTNGWIELSEWDGTYAFTGVVDHFNWRVQYERDAGIDDEPHGRGTQTPLSTNWENGIWSHFVVAKKTPESRTRGRDENCEWLRGLDSVTI